MIVNCRNCLIEFDKKIAEIKRTRNHYCSKKCKGDFLSKTNEEMFFRKTRENGGCLEWIGATNNNGYGVTRHNKSVMLAHRASYLISKGDIPSGMCVCHKCDNPICVNPEHLFLGSHEDNMEDMRAKGRKWSKLTFNDVCEIRSSNEKSDVLADKYNVSARAIRYARKSTNWMPLPEPPKE